MKTKQELEQEIKNLKNRIEELENEVKTRLNFTLMYMCKRGKHTFVLQPKAQSCNLLLNGWKEVSKDTLLDFLVEFNIK